MPSHGPTIACFTVVYSLQSYADPLRKFAKEEMSKIIPLYEAKTLFTNIDAIVPAAAVFLADLEAMYTSGHGAATVGDVCLRHVSVR